MSLSVFVLFCFVLFDPFYMILFMKLTSSKQCVGCKYFFCVNSDRSFEVTAGVRQRDTCFQGISLDSEDNPYTGTRKVIRLCLECPTNFTVINY